MSDTSERLAAALSDRYRIEREIGAGGMATVYLAEDLKHNRKVAIKVLKPELAAALGAERFLREITTTANLRHPHILPLYDSGAVEGLLYYVMPLVEGESLRERLQREKQLPLEDALRIAREAADALSYAHSRGIVHRDIKPENILLESGHAVVADFGIARALDVAGGDRITDTGLSIGTPTYMSPEQAAGDRDIDGRSDLYSLGCVLYEMLGGQPPFTGPTVESIIHQHLVVDAPPITNLRPAVPPGVGAALQRALAKTPADRFNPVAQFADALGGVPHEAPAPSRDHRRLRWVVAAAVVVAILATGGIQLRARGPAVAPGVVRSLAVLPLDNYSGDPAQDYFAEGMTDELTAELAGIRQLRVTSRGSAMQFRGKDRPATPVIAKALDVDAVVEGSVMRSGDDVRITVELIDARADRQLWAHSFERRSRDVLALQAELAGAIAREISVQLTPSERSRLAAAPTVDPRAHDAYLKGRYFFNRPSDANLEKAIAQFDQAVELSPDFAPAWSGLSDAYLWAAFNEGFISAADAGPKARDAAERAVRLDSTAAEGHTSLATYLAWFAHDWAGSEREFRRAVALNPNYAFAHDQFGLVLTILGRFDEARAEGRRAMALDPLSPSILIDASVAYLFLRDTATGAALGQRAADLDPTFYFPLFQDAWFDVQVGRYAQAVPLLEKARRMDAPSFVTGLLAYAYGKSGDHAQAMAALADLKKMSRSGEGLPYDLALFYLGQNDTTHALDELEKAFAANAQSLVWLKEDPIYDPLRHEPRFIALMRKMHFTQ